MIPPWSPPPASSVATGTNLVATCGLAGVCGVARVEDKPLDAPTYLFERGDARHPLKERPLTPGVPQVLGGPAIDVQPVSLPLASYAPMLRPTMLAELMQGADARIAAAQQAW